MSNSWLPDPLVADQNQIKLIIHSKLPGTSTGYSYQRNSHCHQMGNPEMQCLSDVLGMFSARTVQHDGMVQNSIQVVVLLGADASSPSFLQRWSKTPSDLQFTHGKYST